MRYKPDNPKSLPNYVQSREAKINQKSSGEIIQFLPEIFRTDINKQFFDTVVSQLLSSSTLENIDHYWGKFSSFYDIENDTYNKETNSLKQHLQFTPGFGLNDNDGKTVTGINFYNIIKSFENANIDVLNWDKTFTEPAYVLDLPINIDMMMNYENYYWVQAKLPCVDIEPSGVDDDSKIDLVSIRQLDSLTIVENILVKSVKIYNGMRIRFVGDVSKYNNLEAEGALKLNVVYLVGNIGNGKIIFQEDGFVANAVPQPTVANPDNKNDLQLPYASVLNVDKLGENFDDTNFDEIGGGLLLKEYVTIDKIVLNGDTQFHNRWTANNLWYYSKAIKETCKYLGIDETIYLTTGNRAKYPIIQFESDLELVDDVVKNTRLDFPQFKVFADNSNVDNTTYNSEAFQIEGQSTKIFGYQIDTASELENHELGFVPKYNPQLADDVMFTFFLDTVKYFEFLNTKSILIPGPYYYRKNGKIQNVWTWLFGSQRVPIVETKVVDDRATEEVVFDLQTADVSLPTSFLVNNDSFYIDTYFEKLLIRNDNFYLPFTANGSVIRVKNENDTPIVIMVDSVSTTIGANQQRVITLSNTIYSRVDVVRYEIHNSANMIIASGNIHFAVENATTIKIFKNGLVFNNFTRNDENLITIDSSNFTYGDVFELNYVANTDSSNMSDVKYDVPGLFKYNPQNLAINEISQSQILVHLHSQVMANPAFDGNAIGENNFNEIANINYYGGTIRKQLCVPYRFTYLLSNPKTNPLIAFQTIGNDYDKFYSNFKTKVKQLYNADKSLQIAEVVDQALLEMNLGKTETSKYAYSNMAYRLSDDGILKEVLISKDTNFDILEFDSPINFQGYIHEGFDIRYEKIDSSGEVVDRKILLLGTDFDFIDYKRINLRHELPNLDDYQYKFKLKRFEIDVLSFIPPSVVKLGFFKKVQPNIDITDQTFGVLTLHDGTIYHTIHKNFTDKEALDFDIVGACLYDLDVRIANNMMIFDKIDTITIDELVDVASIDLTEQSNIWLARHAFADNPANRSLFEISPYARFAQIFELLKIKPVKIFEVFWRPRDKKVLLSSKSDNNKNIHSIPNLKAIITKLTETSPSNAPKPTGVYKTIFDNNDESIIEFLGDDIQIIKSGENFSSSTSLKITKDGDYFGSAGITLTPELKTGVVNYVPGFNMVMVEYVSQFMNTAENLSALLDSIRFKNIITLSGYSNKQLMDIFLDNSYTKKQVRLTDQDYEIFLNKSPPLKSIYYSGIKITKDKNTYKVNGYDNISRQFLYHPVNVSGDNIITVIQSKSPRNIKRYTSFLKTAEKLSYNHCFESIQSLYNFVIGVAEFYARWGFIENGNDWVIAADSMALWALSDETEPFYISGANNKGNLILSNVSNFVDVVKPNYNGVNFVVNKNDNVIDAKDLSITRENDITTFSTKIEGQHIFGLQIDIVSYDHNLAFNAVSEDGDFIYDPVWGIGQQRIRVSGLKTANWQGRLEAPGYLIDNDKIIANLETSVREIEHDTYLLSPKHISKQTRQSLFGNVGYQKPDYMINTGVPDISAQYFNVGERKNTGTVKNINAFVRNNNLHSSFLDIDIIEEWMIRANNYGNANRARPIEIEILPKDIRTENQIIQLNDEYVYDDPNDLTIDIYPNDPRFVSGNIYSRFQLLPKNNEFDFFASKAYENFLNHSGLPLIDEITYQVYSPDNFDTIYDKEANFARIREWQANVFYNINDIVRYNGRTYKLNVDNNLENPSVEGSVANPKVTSGSTFIVNGNQLIFTKHTSQVILVHKIVSRINPTVVSGDVLTIQEAEGLNPNVIIFQGDFDDDNNKVTNMDIDDIYNQIKRGVTNEDIFISVNDDRNQIIIETKNVIKGLDVFVKNSIEETADDVETLFAAEIDFIETSKTINVDEVLTTDEIVMQANNVFAPFGVRVNKNTAGNLVVESDEFPVYIGDGTANAQLGFTPTEVSPSNMQTKFDINKWIEIDDPANFTIQVVNDNVNGIMNTWNVYQTFDFYLGVVDICPGIVDTDMALIKTNSLHYLNPGDRILIVSHENDDLNGFHLVTKIENTTSFYIDKFIDNKSSGGKILPLRSMRFANSLELYLSFQNIVYGIKDSYGWKNGMIAYVDTYIPEELFLSIINDEVFLDGRNINEEITKNALGAVYACVNESDDVLTFMKIRDEELKINLQYLENITLYNSRTNTLIQRFEFFDPYKGVIPGVAMREINHVSNFDVADYNENAWADNKINTVWWDTHNAIYLNYEYSDNTYRKENWGKLYPTSTIDIYEWTQSLIPPEEYDIHSQNNDIVNGVKITGQAYFVMRNEEKIYSYTESFLTNPTTGIATKFYYFWVKNKTTKPQNRLYSVKQLQHLIVAPADFEIPFCMAIGEKAVVVNNLNSKINNQADTILQINFNVNEMINSHDEYLLLAKSGLSSIPENLHALLRDSLAQYFNDEYIYEYQVAMANKKYSVNDIIKVDNVFYKVIEELPSYASVDGNEQFYQRLYDVEDLGIVDGKSRIKILATRSLPNVYLHRNEKYGQGFRKSIVKNVEEGRREIFNKINEQIKNINFVDLFLDEMKFLQNEAYVFGQHNYNFARLWQYIDWVKPGYTASLNDNFIAEIESINSIEKITTAVIGSKVKILNSKLDARVTIAELTTCGWQVIFGQNGTIQFNDLLWNKQKYDYNFADAFFDTLPFDNYPLFEVYTLLDLFYFKIYTGQFQPLYQELWFTMLQYVVNSVDTSWAFKTTFIDVVYKKLLQSNNLKTINQVNELRRYIELNKPFHTKIKSMEEVDTVNEEISLKVRDSVPFVSFEGDVLFNDFSTGVWERLCLDGGDFTSTDYVNCDDLNFEYDNLIKNNIVVYDYNGVGFISAKAYQGLGSELYVGAMSESVAFIQGDDVKFLNTINVPSAPNKFTTYTKNSSISPTSFSADNSILFTENIPDNFSQKHQYIMLVNSTNTQVEFIKYSHHDRQRFYNCIRGLGSTVPIPEISSTMIFF